MMHILIALYLCIAGCIASAKSAESNYLELTSSYYPPYQGKGLPVNGFVTEIIKQSLALKGYELKVNFYPWSRSLELAKANLVDGIFMITHDARYDQYFYFSRPIVDIKLNLIGLKENIKLTKKYTNPAQLKTLLITSGKDYILPKILQREYLTIQETIDDQTGLWMLLNKKVDVVLIDEAVANNLIAKFFTAYKDKFFFWSEEPIEHMKQYLAISKQHKDGEDLVYIVNSGLKKLQLSGAYDKIISDFDA
jgi:polar amino acid transport system substrate-binding protein